MSICDGMVIGPMSALCSEPTSSFAARATTRPRKSSLRAHLLAGEPPVPAVEGAVDAVGELPLRDPGRAADDDLGVGRMHWLGFNTSRITSVRTGLQ